MPRGCPKMKNDEGFMYEALQKAQGFSDLHVAASNGDLRSVRAIIKSGTHGDINALESGLELTPLCGAISSKHIPVIEELIRAGADVNKRVSFDGDMTPLIVGILTGDARVVKVLLDNGADISDRGIENSSMVHFAADCGHTEIVKLFLDRGLDIEDGNERNETPLHTSANIGRIDTVRLLLARGANVNARCTVSKGDIDNTQWESNVTPLYLASCRGHYEIANLLIAAGADVNAKTGVNCTALHMAAQVGHIALVKRLLKAGAASSINVQTNDDLGYTPLILAAKTGKVDLVELLLEVEGIVNNPTAATKETPLVSAAGIGHLAVVKLLLAKGVPIDGRTTDMMTPLHVALKKEKYEVAEFLITNGADINAVDIHHSTPLLIACAKGNLKLVKMLLKKNANLNARTEKGMTVLQFAAQRDQLEVVKFLVDRGANVFVMDEDHSTALNYAVEGNSIKTLKYLLTKVSEDDDLSTVLKKPLITAVVNGHTEIVKILCARGVSVNEERCVKCSLLHTALKRGHLEIAKVLLRHKARVNYRDHDGCSPLFIAVEMKHEKFVSLLLDKNADVNAANDSGVLPIHVAVKAQSVNIAKALLIKGACYNAEVNMENYKGTPLKFAQKLENAQLVDIFESIKKLFGAVIKNDTDLIKRCIKAGSIVNARNVNGRTALHYAVSNLNIHAVNALIANGADIVLATNKGNLPLHTAVLNESVEITEVLLEHAENLGSLKFNFFVNANTRGSFSTALHIAAEKNNLLIVKLLLASGAAYNPLNGKCKTPQEMTTDEAVESLLISAETLFRALKKKGDLEKVLPVLENLCLLHARETDIGGTPLYWSILKGHNDIAKEILSRNIAYCLVTNKGSSPLHAAASEGNTEMVKVLVNLAKNKKPKEASEFINARTMSGKTALHVASNSEVVKCLLCAGAAYNIRNVVGKTALELVQDDSARKLLETTHQIFNDVEKGLSGVMETVNSLNADELKAIMNAQNERGLTLVKVAQRNGYFRIADKLLKKVKY